MSTMSRAFKNIYTSQKSLVTFFGGKRGYVQRAYFYIVDTSIKVRKKGLFRFIVLCPDM